MRVYRPVPVESTNEAPAASRLQGSIERVGIVDDALDPHLIEGVIDQLRDLIPEAQIKIWPKPVGTSPAPDSLIEEVAREAQVALAGVGM